SQLSRRTAGIAPSHTLPEQFETPPGALPLRSHPQKRLSVPPGESCREEVIRCLAEDAVPGAESLPVRSFGHHRQHRSVTLLAGADEAVGLPRTEEDRKFDSLDADPRLTGRLSLHTFPTSHAPLVCQKRLPRRASGHNSVTFPLCPSASE